jgi:Mannose-6-phosphate isomerase
MKGLLAVLALGVTVANPAAQTTAPAPSKRPTVAAPKPTSVRISVKDQDGASLSGVRLLLSGTTGGGEFTTGAAGTAIVPIPKPGLFRMRCEAEGFVTLEKEFTVGGGAWNPIDVVLNAAPPPPPAAQAGPRTGGGAPIPSSGPPLTMSIPDFVDKNFIGRDPMKESILACKPRENRPVAADARHIAQHVHDGVDEIIYVVAGDGAMRIGEEESPLHAGSLVFVPNGNGHSMGRKGKNPLIVISTLIGSSCDSSKSAP